MSARASGFGLRASGLISSPLQFWLMLLLLLTVPKPDGYLWAQDCATSEPISTPSIFDLSCNDMDYISLQTNADRFAPLPDDDLKIVRLRFVFLQRPGDEATGIGGFHLSNPKHLKYWNEVASYMNWVLTDDLHLTANGPNQCEGADNDTRIRFDVEMVNMEDEYYWNNLNNAGFPSGICDNCPRDESWYLNPLQQNLYNNEGCEHRINIFFTERADVYQQAINIPLNSEGLPTDPLAAFPIFDPVCNTDCSLFPTAFADDGDGLELRVHMLDEYNSYIAQKLCLKSDNSSYDCDPASYWYDEEDAFIINDWVNNRYIWQVGSTARLILHELGHSFGLLHTDDSTWPFLNTECNLMCGHDDTRNQIYGAQQKAVHKAFSTLSNERYIKDCPYSPNHPIEITGTETWTNEIRLYSDLIVRTGAKLTVKCIVHMPPNGRIIVERGAKLIVDGGIITDTNCECERWQGIEVWGNADQAHQTYIDPAGLYVGEDILAVVAPLSNYENATLNPDAPGIVVLKNDATIENGPNGTITTQRRGGYFPDYYGGIVVAENAHFINCKRGVEFMQYLKYRNYSRFKDCTFQNTIPQTNFAGISIWDCKRIIVDNCTFDYGAEFPIPSATTYRFGIEAYDARRLLVRNGCDFLRLKEGIKLACSTTTTATIGTNEMNPNVFEETTTGIQSLGRNTLIAENNQFTGTPTLHTGIILGMAHNQYYVHNNQFTSMKTGVAASSTGVTEISDNNIECNRFDYCKTGILSAGQNDGLQFYDNQFLTTIADVKVRQIPGENGSVQEVQGWISDFEEIVPFFNFFSLDRPLDRITTVSTTDLFWYYYHTDPEYTAVANNRLTPQCYIGDDCGFSYN